MIGRDKIVPKGLGFIQHQGRRDYQEDSCGFEISGDGGDKFAIIALADGMGGHVGGAAASKIAVETALDKMSELTALPKENLAEDLSERVELANASIISKLEEEPSLSGMGTTLVLLSVQKQGYFFASVGDSPLWIYRNDEFIRLNADHSMVPVLEDMVEAGRMTEEDASRDSMRNSLRSALVGEEIDLLDISDEIITSNPNDILILASDGLQTLSDEEISELIAPELDAQELAELLNNSVLAKKTSNQDNITVAVVKMADFFSQPGTLVSKEVEKIEEKVDEEEPVTQPLKRPSRTEEPAAKKTKNVIFVIILTLMILAILGYVFFINPPENVILEPIEGAK